MEADLEGLRATAHPFEEEDIVETRARDAASTAGLKELIFEWGALPNKSGPATPLIETKVHVKGPRLVFWGNARCESLYVACMGHEKCTAKWRIIRAGPDIVIQQHGEHTPQESDANKKWKKLRAKKHIAASSEPVGRARNALLRELAGPAEPSAFPSLREATVYKSHSARLRRPDSGDTTYVEELAPYLAGKPENDAPHTAIVPKDFVELTNMTCVPFTCNFFLQACVDFLAKCEGKVHFTADFTHDACRAQMKLGCFALVGCHFDHGMWRNSAIPLTFCIASKEVTGSALMTIQAGLAMFKKFCGIDLRTRLGHGTLDGNPGLHEACRVELPECTLHRCLEHSKRNVMKHGKLWAQGNKTHMYQGIFDCSAFVPSKVLFHCIWDREFARLESAGETAMAKYLKKFQVVEGPDGLFTASWRSSCLEVPPGYGTYLPNALESLWRVLDTLSPVPELTRDIKEIVTSLERNAEAWSKSGRFTDVAAKPHGVHLLVSTLLRGGGLMSCKGGLYTKQFRRQTVEKIRVAAEAGHTVMLPFGAGPHWDEAWVMPKQHAHIQSMERALFFHTLLSATSVAEVRQAAVAAGGVQDGVLSYSWLRQLLGEYTLVIRKGAVLIDTHRDFMLHGVSEQRLYLMISLGHMACTPLAGAKPKTTPRSSHKRAAAEAMVQTPRRRAEADPTETAAPAGAPPRNQAGAGHEERAESEPTETPGNPATPPTTGPRSPTDLAIDSWVQCDACATWRLVPEGTMREFSGDRVFKCAYAAFVCKAKRPRAR